MNLNTQVLSNEQWKEKSSYANDETKQQRSI